MTRLIDADALNYVRVRIYHDDGTIGGYNAVVPSSEIRNAPTVDAIPMWFFEMERRKLNYLIETEVKHGDMDEAFRIEKTIAVMDGIIADWRRERHG